MLELQPDVDEKFKDDETSKAANGSNSSFTDVKATSSVTASTVIEPALDDLPSDPVGSVTDGIDPEVMRSNVLTAQATDEIETAIPLASISNDNDEICSDKVVLNLVKVKDEQQEGDEKECDVTDSSLLKIDDVVSRDVSDKAECGSTVADTKTNTNIKFETVSEQTSDLVANRDSEKHSAENVDDKCVDGQVKIYNVLYFSVYPCRLS